MEKIDKTRGFSVRETKLDNGQVKLKLAVLPVPKREQPNSSTTYNPPAEDHCSPSEPSTPATPAPLADRGKWRPIGFTPVDQHAGTAVSSSEAFLARSNLSSSSSTYLLPSSNESAPFLSCFGAASAGVNTLLFDSSASSTSLKPFQIAAVVKPSVAANQSSSTTFASPVNQLYRSTSAVPSHAHAPPTFRLSIFDKTDRLVSSGSDTGDMDEDSDSDEKRHSPLFSSLISSHSLAVESSSQAIKKQPPKINTGPSRKKRKEIDDLLNTWTVAPTAGKLLRQEKPLAVDSDQRVSRRSAAAATSNKRSPKKSPVVAPPETRGKITPERKGPIGGKGKTVSSAKLSEEPPPPPPPRPPVTLEQIDAVLLKLVKIAVSPEGKTKCSEAAGGRSVSRSSGGTKSFKFLSTLSPESTLTVTRKRFCSSAVSRSSLQNSEEAVAETAASTKLPPKKRHKQLSPISPQISSQNASSSQTPFDAATLSKLVERQSAAIAFVRPSLFDLKREHEERMNRLRPPVTAFPAINQRQSGGQKGRVKPPPPPAQDSRPPVNEQSPKITTAPALPSGGEQEKEQASSTVERLPLKLRISLSKILASRPPQIANEANEASRGRKVKLRSAGTTNQSRTLSTLKMAKLTSTRRDKLKSPVKSPHSPLQTEIQGYGLRTRRSLSTPNSESAPGVQAAEPISPPPVIQPLPSPKEKVLPPPLSSSKPGRGRPKLIKTPVINNKGAVLEEETVPSSPSSNEQVAVNKPRSRGRPPKLSLSTSSITQPPSAEKEKQKQQAVRANPTKSLRKTERKQKPAVKQEEKVVKEEEKEAEIEEPLAKLRKRGRPSFAEKTSPASSSKNVVKSETKVKKVPKQPVAEQPQQAKSSPVKVDKATKVLAEGKLVLKRIKTAKKYQLAGLFSDTFKEEHNDPCELPASEMSSLASPTSEISGDVFGGPFSPMNSPTSSTQQPPSTNGHEKYSGAILPLPPPAALSVLYERSYFELPHDLWILNNHGLLNRPTHPGENFRRVRNNIYTPAARQLFGARTEQPEPCRCQIRDDQVCTDDCINKQLFVECCAESCPCFQKCANRRFQNGCDMAKIARFETESCGSGVKAKKLIQKADFIVEYTGEVVGEREFRRRMVEWYAEDEHHYAFNLEGGAVIDAYRMGSFARFVNHSCEPNCQMQKWTVLGLPRVGLFALRDISAGEELSYDYNFNWFDKGSRQVCKCGSKQCRGFIGSARRNSVSASDSKKMIQPLEKWRLANQPRPFSVREYQAIEARHVILRRNVRSMSKKLNAIIARKKRKQVVIAQAGGISQRDPNNNGTNSLFVAQFQALSTSRSVSTRCLSEAESSSTSRSVDMALFLEQLLTSLMMHRDSDGAQPASPFITLPRRKHCQAYFDLVTKPIDFSTIERNITAGRYPTFDSFNDDVRLLLDNVKLAGHLLLPSNKGTNLEQVFYELADTYDKLLRNFEAEISEFRKCFPSVEFEDVVRCICGRLNEEGTMVQCEKCQLWQHTDCVGVNMHAMPDSYTCFLCLPPGKPGSAPAFSKEIPLPHAQLPPDAQAGCRYFLTMCTKTGLQVRVDECYTINRQSLPFDVPFCKIDKLYSGIFYIDRLFIDPSNRKFIYGVHLVYPFEVHVDHSRRFFPKEVLATLWYDKLPIEIISGQCWVLDSSLYARGRPRTATSEELVYICDNGLDKHAKAMHKLNEPMSTVCTKRYAFDYFLVPLRPERNVTAGEIHERMFATRREELAKQAAAPSIPQSLSSTSESSSVVGSPESSKNDASPSDEDEELPLSKLSQIKATRKRVRLNKIAEKLALKASSVKLDPDVIPDWLIKPGLPGAKQVEEKIAEKHEKEVIPTLDSSFGEKENPDEGKMSDKIEDQSTSSLPKSVESGDQSSQKAESSDHSAENDTKSNSISEQIETCDQKVKEIEPLESAEKTNQISILDEEIGQKMETESEKMDSVVENMETSEGLKAETEENRESLAVLPGNSNSISEKVEKSDQMVGETSSPLPEPEKVPATSNSIIEKVEASDHGSVQIAPSEDVEKPNSIIGKVEASDQSAISEGLVQKTLSKDVEKSNSLPAEETSEQNVAEVSPVLPEIELAPSSNSVSEDSPKIETTDQKMSEESSQEVETEKLSGQIEKSEQEVSASLPEVEAEKSDLISCQTEMEDQKIEVQVDSPKIETSDQKMSEGSSFLISEEIDACVLNVLAEVSATLPERILESPFEEAEKSTPISVHIETDDQHQGDQITISPQIDVEKGELSVAESSTNPSKISIPLEGPENSISMAESQIETIEQSTKSEEISKSSIFSEIELEKSKANMEKIEPEENKPNPISSIQVESDVREPDRTGESEASEMQSSTLTTGLPPSSGVDFDNDDERSAADSIHFDFYS